MAMPPILGITTECTSRALGTATAPSLTANLRTRPVSRYVTAAAVRPTSRYSRTGRPAGVASVSACPQPSRPSEPTVSGDHGIEHFGDLGPGHRTLAQHPRGLVGQV